METFDLYGLASLRDKLIEQQLWTDDMGVRYIKDAQALQSGGQLIDDHNKFWTSQSKKLGVVSSLATVLASVADDVDNGPMLCRLVEVVTDAIRLVRFPRMGDWVHDDTPTCPACGEAVLPGDLSPLIVTRPTFDSLTEDEEPNGIIALASETRGGDLIVLRHVRDDEDTTPCLIKRDSITWNYN